MRKRASLYSFCKELKPKIKLKGTVYKTSNSAHICKSVCALSPPDPSSIWHMKNTQSSRRRDSFTQTNKQSQTLYNFHIPSQPLGSTLLICLCAVLSEVCRSFNSYLELSHRTNILFWCRVCITSLLKTCLLNISLCRPFSPSPVGRCGGQHCWHHTGILLSVWAHTHTVETHKHS